jgi:hypothetical protein
VETCVVCLSADKDTLIAGIVLNEERNPAMRLHYSRGQRTMSAQAPLGVTRQGRSSGEL